MDVKVKNEKFWELIKDIRFVCAPMVNQSELPFRMLCRELGVKLCYTPMIHSASFLRNARYREEVFTTCSEDRPLVAQFCGNNPDTLLEAASQIQHQVDAVDINFGCPQAIAKKGNYGAYLLEQTELALSLCKALVDNLDVAVTVKIRILSNLEDTIFLCKEFERVGAALITVHGRKREKNKELQGACDLESIKVITRSVAIPVFANGGATNREEALQCLESTNCQAYMGAESLLSDPSCFLPPEVRWSPLESTRRYLELVKLYPVTGREMKSHLFKMLRRELCILTHLRTKIQTIKDKTKFFGIPDEIESGIREFEQRYGPGEYDRLYKLTLPWYWRYFLTESQLCDKLRFKEELKILTSREVVVDTFDNVNEVPISSRTCIVS